MARAATPPSETSVTMSGNTQACLRQLWDPSEPDWKNSPGERSTVAQKAQKLRKAKLENELSVGLGVQQS